MAQFLSLQNVEHIREIGNPLFTADGEALRGLVSAVADPDTGA